MKKIILLACFVIIASLAFAEGEENTGGEIQNPEIPAGCTMETGDTGIQQINCQAGNKQEFKEFDVKPEIEKCDGKFEMIDGKPTCIKEGRGELTGIVCPSDAELAAVKSGCSGTTKEFSDPNGCKSAMCVNDGFDKKFEDSVNEKYSGMKADAIICEKNNGQLVMVKGKAECIESFDEKLAIKENVGEMGKDEIENAAEKVNGIENAIEKITLNIQKLELSSEGKAAEVLKGNLEKLEEISGKITAMKDGLDTSLSMTEEQKINLISDMHSVQKGLSNVALGIAKGEVITDAAQLEAEYMRYAEYYGRPFSKEELEAGVENEKSAMDKIKGCENYAEAEGSFDPPDPENNIILVQLKYINGKCEMAMNTKMGKNAVFLLAKETYRTFSSPNALATEPCEGEACEFIKTQITQPHGDTPEQICTEKCIYKDCTLGPFSCQQKNLTKCEYECGLKKEGEGPFDSKGNFDPMQACVMFCAGDESKECRQGGTNPTCNACEGKCIDVHGPGRDYEKCVTAKQLDELKAGCESAGQYAEPVEEFVFDKMCLTSVTCKEFEKRSEDSGTGPDSVEPGHGIGEEFGPPATESSGSGTAEGGGEPSAGGGGENTAPPTGELTLIDGIANWVKGLFR